MNKKILKLRNIIREVIDEVIELNESDDIIKIRHNRNDLYVKKDKDNHTHIMISKNIKDIHNDTGEVYHIRQLSGRPYQTDLRKWLHGKKDIDGNFYKD